MDLPYKSVVNHVTWPAPLAPSASNRLAVLFQLELSQWWPAEQLQRAQFRQLRELLPYAVRHVPHYARTLGGVADPASIDPQRWSELPILTRTDLYQARQELVSRQIPKEHGQQHPVKTSGSTGLAVELLGTDLTGFFWKVFCLREHLWHRRDFSRKLLAFRFVRDPSAKSPRVDRAPGWGPATDDLLQTGPAALCNIQLDVSYLADRLLEEKPGYLLSHPSLLAGLIDHCRQRGTRPEGLLELRSIGESLPEGLREACREAWGIPLVDLYTCQEAGYLAAQCPQHAHYHVQSENVLLEVVDANGRACQPGEVGRVLITSLHNFATPLIRYELGDCAEVGEPCPCGRGLPVLSRVMGRYRNLLTLPSGEQRWPRMGYESLRKLVPVELMQMVQHSLEDIEVKLVMAQPLTPEQQQALTAHIHRNLGHPFKLRFEYVAGIRSSTNGKVEQFISKLQPAPGLRV